MNSKQMTLIVLGVLILLALWGNLARECSDNIEHDTTTVYVRIPVEFPPVSVEEAKVTEVVRWRTKTKTDSSAVAELRSKIDSLQNLVKLENAAIVMMLDTIITDTIGVVADCTNKTISILYRPQPRLVEVPQLTITKTVQKETPFIEKLGWFFGGVGAGFLINQFTK